MTWKKKKKHKKLKERKKEKAKKGKINKLKTYHKHKYMCGTVEYFSKTTEIF